MKDVQAFYEALAADKDMQERIAKKDFPPAMRNDIKKTLIGFAAENGFTFTEEDLEAYVKSASAGTVKAMSDWDNCFCAMGGGGYNHTGNYSCACVLAGFGGVDKDGVWLCCSIFGELGYPG